MPKGNSSGKRLSNFRSHDASCGRRFVYTNSVAQSSAQCSSSSYDQVSLFPTFLLLVCRYLKERKSNVMRKKKGFMNEHPSRLWKGTNLFIVRSPQQNICPNNDIRDSREQERMMVPPYRKRFPNVWTCPNASVDTTNSWRMMAIISPGWINIESSQISIKSSRIR